MATNKTGANLLAHNTVLNFIGQVIPLFCGLIAIPIIIRGLGIDGFGILSLAWLLLGYFAIFDLGLSRATTKYVSEYLGRGEIQTIPPIIWLTTGLQLIFGIVGTILFIIFIPFLANHVFKIPYHLIKETTFTFYILAVSLPIVLVSTGLKGTLESAQRFDLVNLVKIPCNALIFIIPAIVVQFAGYLPVIILLLSIVRLFSLIGYLVFCFKVFPQLKTSFGFEIKLLKNLMSFGLWITVSSVLAPVLNYIERFFIASVLSVGMLGFYTAPYEAISRLTIFSASIATTLFPAISHYSAMKPSSIEEMFLRPMKYLFVIISPVAVFLLVFSREILNFWLGSSFVQNSTIVFQILTITFFVNCLATIPFTSLQGLGRADIKAKLDIVESFIFVGLVWILILIAGINGVASAKLIITLIDIGLLLWFSHRLIHFSIESLLKYKIVQTLIISIIFCLIIIVLDLLVNKPMVLFLFFIVNLIYVSVIWKFGMDDKDRVTIKDTGKGWLKQ